MRFLFAIFLAGCVPVPDPTNAPCPCGDGYECCPTLKANQQCVASGHLERCIGTESCALPDGTPATLSLTEGFDSSTQSTPLDATGDMTLYYGFQNGFHVYTQLPLTRFYPNDVKVTRALRDHATGMLLRKPQIEVLGFVCDAGNWVLLNGQRMIVCPSEPTAGLITIHDRMLDVQVDLESQRTGQTLTQTFALRPHCNPGDTEHYAMCMSSSAGCGQGP